MKCIKCNRLKRLEDFSKKNGKIRDVCKECHNIYQRNYYKNNKEKYKKHKEYTNRKDLPSRRNWYRHGLTLEDYTLMFNKYEGMCYACKENPITHIDHDHFCCKGGVSCGDCVRGLLCQGCNITLGFVKDDISRLENLIDYLKRT